MIGLFAMSVVAMWWTEADAACVQWKHFFGKQICTQWRTKGVMVGVGFDEYDCGPKGEACKFKANAEAEANHSFAFCKNKGTGKIRRVKLHVPLSFSGSADGCDPGDHDSDDDRDHDSDDDSDDDTVCSATIVLERQTECKVACTDEETCIDATPFDMKTSVDACIGIGLKECIEPTPPTCSEESPICTIKEQCTIKPNKIAFNRVKRFRCEQQ